MPAKILLVDIKHPSGYAELGHKVEVAQHSRLTEDQQVEDHLRVKLCPHTNHRGSWAWSYSKKAEKAAAAEPKPKAKSGAEPKPKA